MNPVRFLSIALLGLLTLSTASADIPTRPEYGVLDQAAVLSLPILKATERLLAQHEQLTEERLSIYTVTGIPKGGLSEIADPVFEEWRKDAPRPPSALILFIDADHGDLEIRTGLGLDPVVTSLKIAEIEKRFFKPEWKSGKKSRAIVLSLVEVLRDLDSPLIASGEAMDTYNRAGFSGGWEPAVYEPKTWMAWLLALVGIAAAAFVLMRILTGEVHYTATGWFRVPAHRNLRNLFSFGRKTTTLVTGGGVSGKY